MAPTPKLLTRPVAELTNWDRNPRAVRDQDFERLKRQIAAHGQFKPLIVTPDGTVIGGNMRLRAYRALGITDAWVSVVEPKDEAERVGIALADNDRAGYYVQEELAELVSALEGLDLGLYHVDLEDTVSLDQLLDTLGPDGSNPTGISLMDRFVVPPFSVLDARQGYWQERKRFWLDMGIQSELGRDIAPTSVSATGPAYMSQKVANNDGGSIFDPVLAEVAYRWFCPAGGTVLDPFAGGSVRGIVASHLGRQYVGVELSAPQVQANQEQATAIAKDPQPVWAQGDSAAMLDSLQVSADLVFTCPPYADLEIYSQDPADISNMPYPKFLAAYRDILAKACAKLADNRFAVIVVGEVRDPKGIYRNLVADTVQAFAGAGLSYYNEAILVTMGGTLPMRAAKAFIAGRKLGKHHQNVLVFVKGDPKLATQACGTITIEDLAPEEDDASA